MVIFMVLFVMASVNMYSIIHNFDYILKENIAPDSLYYFDAVGGNDLSKEEVLDSRSNT